MAFGFTPGLQSLVGNEWRLNGMWAKFSSTINWSDSAPLSSKQRRVATKS